MRVSGEPAVVLLSGGIDSTTALAIAVAEGYRAYALSVRYGQRHEIEIEAARRIAQYFRAAQHVVLDLDLRQFGGSALTGGFAVPKDRKADQIGHGIPATYVPARNTIFLALALAWAEVLGANDIFLGVNAIDYSGYPDCRPEYLEAFEHLARRATKAGVEGRQRLRIHAPLLYLSKAEIIRKGLELGVDYSMTRTCYDPSPAGEACGRCDACQLRRKGFAEAGVEDPAVYRPDAPPAPRPASG